MKWRMYYQNEKCFVMLFSLKIRKVHQPTYELDETRAFSRAKLMYTLLRVFLLHLFIRMSPCNVAPVRLKSCSISFTSWIMNVSGLGTWFVPGSRLRLGSGSKGMRSFIECVYRVRCGLQSTTGLKTDYLVCLILNWEHMKYEYMKAYCK